jgi:hypothetical protein
MVLERLDGIRGTAWIIAARGRQEGPEGHLVAAHDKNEELPHHGVVMVGAGSTSSAERQRIS